MQSMAGDHRLMFGGWSMLVTGGSQGMGAATARLAASRGANVMIASPDAAGLERVAGEISGAGGICAWTTCDVTKSEEVRAMVGASVQRFGSLDLAFVNAGISHPPVLPEEVDDELLDHLLSMNVKGAFACCREAGKAMLAQGRGGAILVNGSMSGITGVGSMLPYATSKHAAAGMVKALAVAWGPRGIRVNYQGPGATETPMLDQAMSDVATFRDTHPMQTMPAKMQAPLARTLTAEEQADVACFLLSEAASAMTGAIVMADGGLTAY
jgi:NAD(P)-dependent dehydrogenase (short-subunit alcohol dehydrogenase family)